MTVKRRNNYIELLRYIACYLIFSYHTYGSFPGGWIMVEFFFIMSGYFAVNHIYKAKQNNSLEDNIVIKYTLNKFLHILPYSATGIFLYAVLAITKYKFHGKGLIRFLTTVFNNLIFITTTGAIPKSSYITNQYSIDYLFANEQWYLGALFVTIPILVLICIKFDKSLSQYCFFFLPFLMYGYIIFKSGTIVGWHKEYNTYLFLNMRALAGCLIGGAVWTVAGEISKWEISKCKEILMTIIEILSFAGVCFLAIDTKIGNDIFQIIFIAVSLSLTFSGKTLTSKISLKLFERLGRLSLPIYCIHAPIVRALSRYGYEINGIKERVIAFTIVTVCAQIILWCFDGIRKLFNRKRTKNVAID